MRVGFKGLILLGVFFVMVFPVQAQSRCVVGKQSSGAEYEACLPPGEWNGDLILAAHGYIPPEAPLRLRDTAQVKDWAGKLGFAYAGSSFSRNGLAVQEGVADLVDLVQVFQAHFGPVAHVYLVGASEGGLIVTLAVERYPEVFAGGVAACGPIGDFQDQLNTWGDFRVVFDALFPQVLPASPVAIPEGVKRNWREQYAPSILRAMQANPQAVLELLAVTGAPFDPKRPVETAARTTLDLLWYNAFATQDGIEQLGGLPFDNLNRVYQGSRDDLILNQRVERFRAQPSATAEVQKAYQTRGNLARPLVVLHTSGDPLIRVAQMEQYRRKVLAQGKGSLLTTLKVERYGHCTFTTPEMVAGLATLVQKASGHPLKNYSEVLPSAVDQTAFQRTVEQLGASPDSYRLFMPVIERPKWDWQE